MKSGDIVDAIQGDNVILHRQNGQSAEKVLKKVFAMVQSKNIGTVQGLRSLFINKKQLTIEEIKLTLNEKTPYVET